MPTPTVFVPSSRGRDALGELDRVQWAELAHAYGTGVTGTARWDDVRASLARLGDTDEEAIDDGVYALTCNVYHQGTIYDATASAVPFIAAVAAGRELWAGHARELVVLLGHIAIASAFETDDGTMGGSFGEGVSASTRMALRASRPLLDAAALLHPALRELASAITALAEAEPPTRTEMNAVADAAATASALELGDPPPPPRPAEAQPWVSHAKFGLGQIVGREDAKARVRFVDGSERTLLARVLVPADPPSDG